MDLKFIKTQTVSCRPQNSVTLLENMEIHVGRSGQLSAVSNQPQEEKTLLFKLKADR